MRWFHFQLTELTGHWAKSALIRERSETRTRRHFLKVVIKMWKLNAYLSFRERFQDIKRQQTEDTYFFFPKRREFRVRGRGPRKGTLDYRGPKHPRVKPKPLPAALVRRAIRVTEEFPFEIKLFCFESKESDSCCDPRWPLCQIVRCLFSFIVTYLYGYWPSWITMRDHYIDCIGLKKSSSVIPFVVFPNVT